MPRLLSLSFHIYLFISYVHVDTVGRISSLCHKMCSIHKVEQMNYTYRQIWLINYPVMLSILMEQLINITDAVF